MKVKGTRVGSAGATAGNRPTQEGRAEHEATLVPFRDGCTTFCMMCKRHTHQHVTKQECENQSKRPTNAMDYYFMKNEVGCECSNHTKRISNMHSSEGRQAS